MPPIDALAAASWAAREWLGPARAGRGGAADLVVYDDDPRTDLRRAWPHPAAPSSCAAGSSR